jgi:hypothetical protein
MLAGIITEGQYKAKLNEAEDLSSPEAFQEFMKNIPNEKYFSVLTRDDYNPKGNEFDDDDENDTNVVDNLYEPIFNNELKDKPGIEGNDFYEWIEDYERKEEGFTGERESILIDKIKDIITAYKKSTSLDSIPLTSKVKAYIDDAIQSAKEDGELEYLTDVGFFDTDIIDNILVEFMDEFPDVDDVSQEVKDYIESQL